MIDERFIIGENGVPRPNPALPEEEPAAFMGESFVRRVVSYLLGEMSTEESERFEDECFAQESWPSCVRLAEDDLIDAYLHDELEPEQRVLFERNYLTTEARQARVRGAALLLRCIHERDDVAGQETVRTAGETWAERLKDFWGGHTWRLRAAFAIVALAVLTGGLWLYLLRVRAPHNIATLTLTSGAINRSEGVHARNIKLPPGADALKVVLTLPERGAPTTRYRAELDTEDGETLSLNAQGQDAQSVSVLIPVSKLSRGQYAVTLFVVDDNGTEQPVYGTYIFAVE